MGTTVRNVKRERLEARVTAEQKALIERAAELAGRTLTDFMIGSLQTAAEEAIRTHQVLELTARETEGFIEALENPPRPVERLLVAARRHRELTGR